MNEVANKLFVRTARTDDKRTARSTVPRPDDSIDLTGAIELRPEDRPEAEWTLRTLPGSLACAPTCAL